MEFLRSSGPFRTKLVSVAIRPASKPRLSPLNSLERGGLRAPIGRLTMAVLENTRELELLLLRTLERTHES
jgi:hypothetical protein